MNLVCKEKTVHSPWVLQLVCVITALDGKNQCALKRETHENSRYTLESPMSELGTGSSCSPVPTSAAIIAHRVMRGLGLCRAVGLPSP